MSSACSPGRSRGRSTVGRRHLAFQVAGLQWGGMAGGAGEEGEEGEGKAGQKVNKSMAANGRVAQEWYGSYLCNLLHMGAAVSGWHSPTNTHIHIYITNWGLSVGT